MVFVLVCGLLFGSELVTPARAATAEANADAEALESNAVAFIKGGVTLPDAKGGSIASQVQQQVASAKGGVPKQRRAPPARKGPASKQQKRKGGQRKRRNVPPAPTPRQALAQERMKRSPAEVVKGEDNEFIIAGAQFGIAPFNNLNPFDKEGKINTPEDFRRGMEALWNLNNPRWRAAHIQPTKYHYRNGDYIGFLESRTQTHRRRLRQQAARMVLSAQASEAPAEAVDSQVPPVYELPKLESPWLSPYNNYDPFNPTLHLTDWKDVMRAAREKDLLTADGVNGGPFRWRTLQTSEQGVMPIQQYVFLEQHEEAAAAATAPVVGDCHGCEWL